MKKKVKMNNCQIRIRVDLYFTSFNGLILTKQNSESKKQMRIKTQI